jgi:cardiolipin synthase
MATGLLYSAAAVNCFRIIDTRRSPASTISWLWAHLTLPFLAVPLYWFIGRVRIVEYERKRHIRHFEKIGFGKVQLEGPTSYEGYGKLGEFSNMFSQFSRSLGATQGKVNLLIDGNSTFAAIFAAMNGAKHYIIVQYYILQSDKLGLELKEILEKKAREGVRIYLLYDDMGSFWLSKRYVSELRSAGVRTARFLPVTSLKRLFLVNFRNHRKLVVVDGLYAFTGGLNVGEEYIGSRFKKRREWRDTHLMVSGPCVRNLEEVFFADWHFATGERLAPTIASYWETPEFKVRFERLFAQEGREYVQVIPSGPADPTAIGAIVFSSLIHAATKRIWLATPYFVPDEPLQSALELAVLRGIDVRILLPMTSDVRFVHWVTLSYAEQMQRKGVHVFQYKAGFTHQKVILVDDDLAAVGTANFDYRAMYLNFETMVLTHGRDFAARVEAMLLSDFSNSVEFAPLPESNLGAITRFRDNASRMLAPLL